MGVAVGGCWWRCLEVEGVGVRMDAQWPSQVGQVFSFRKGGFVGAGSHPIGHDVAGPRGGV